MREKRVENAKRALATQRDVYEGVRRFFNALKLVQIATTGSDLA
jgi:hypothetical protein